MKVLILGGGITALSTAWYLKKQDPHVKITLLEKENRLGGWIRTAHAGGYLFEKGPRTFQKGRSPHLIRLIEELKLEIIESDRAARKRFILHKGKLRSLESFLPMCLPYILRELFLPPSNKEDESIYDFALRRFSPKITETLFDPLTLGIYAGDIRKLSIRSCFPSLYKWEREYGSIVKGLLYAPKKAKGLFTVKGGMETLIHAIEAKLNIDVVFNCPVESIFDNEVLAGGKVWSADRIISALPPDLPKKSIWVVNIAYASDVLPKKGFGYLVPTQEKEPLLGVVFDSVIFPERGKGTSLTAILNENVKRPLDSALECLERHLGISEDPVYTSAFFAQNAIPQFEVGCGYTHGVSVDACILRGKNLV